MPFIYGVGLVLVDALGMEYLQHASMLLFYATHLLLFYCMDRTTQMRYGPDKRLLLLTLYVVIIFATSIGRLASIIASLLVFMGSINLFASKWRYSELMGGSLFAFAFLFKVSASYPIIVLILYYFATKKISVRRRKDDIILDFKLIELLKSVFLVVAVPAALILYFFFAYPNLYHYAIDAHTNLWGRTLTDALPVFNPLHNRSPNLLAFYLIVALLAYVYHKKRNHYNITSLLAVPVCFISFAKANQILPLWHYIHLPVLPFFIVSLLGAYEVSGVSYRRRAAMALVVGLVLYNSVISHMDVVKDRELDQFVDEVEHWRKFLPMQEYVLLQNPDVIDNYKRADLLPSGIYSRDSGPVRVLEEKGIISSSSLDFFETHNLSFSFPSYREKIDSMDYSLIAYGPPAWYTITELLEEVDTDVLYQYCPVYAPNLFDPHPAGRHHTKLYFRDEEDCQLFRKKMREYYLDQFDHICSVDEYMANTTANILYMNGIYHRKRCISGGNLLEHREKHADPYHIRNWIYLGLVESVIILYYLGLWILDRKRR